MTSESDTLARLLAYHDHIDVPSVAIEDDVRRGRRRVRRNRGLVAGGAALAFATIVVSASVLSGRDGVQKPQPVMPTPTPTENVAPAPKWPGALREGESWPVLAQHRMPIGGVYGTAWVDNLGDAEVGAIDIQQVFGHGRAVNGYTVGSDGHDVEHFTPGRWGFTVADASSRMLQPGPAGGTIEYGVVVDTDGDRVADCHIAISDDAPQVRDYAGYRVWVTNLRTGITEENVGGPYGFPIDFSYPDEPHRTMSFFFLGGTPASCDRFPGAINFYVYATHSQDGRVTAWDFAPDAAWLKGTRERIG